MPLAAFRLRHLAGAMVAVLMTSPPMVASGKQERKAKEAEAKRLFTSGRNAEKQGRLIDARQSYLDSEHVLFTEDAEKALLHVAVAADEQVRDLMSNAAKAYASENFTKAADLLHSANALHPGDHAIGCNLALTTYQQGERDSGLSLLEECVRALRDKESRRQLAEIHAALDTGDRAIVPSNVKPQVVRFNDAMLAASEKDPQFEDVTPLTTAALCTQLTPLQSRLPTNPALLFNLANCAESEGRAGDADRLLTEYLERAPNAADFADVRQRLAVVKALAALPDPAGSLVRNLYVSALKHVEARAYDLAIADYVNADEAAPGFVESKRRIATLLEAQGQITRARTYGRQVLLAEPNEERRRQIQLVVDGLDGEKTQYDGLVGEARQILQELMGRSLLAGEYVSRIYAAYRLQLANDKIQEAALLLPLASEVNALQAITCAQMNDFRCVHASFDAQRSLGLPLSFYGAIFYEGMIPATRWQQVRTYAKFEFDQGLLRLAEISTVNPKKRTVAPAAVPAGEDRLGGLGAADGLRASKFQGFTVPIKAITHFETNSSLLFLEVNDRSVKRGRMLIDPVRLVLDVPLEGPGARRYINNFVSIGETYGGVPKPKYGNEHTTTGEAFKMVLSAASIGLDVTSLMFGDYSAIMGIAGDAKGLGRKIGVSLQQAERLATTRRATIQGNRFKAIPTEPINLAFRKDLK